MWPAVLMGLKASVNPFALATALVFNLLLSVVRHSRWQLIISGLVFIFMVWLINFFVLSGSYDHLIYKPLMQHLVGGIYSILAVLFIYVGFLHLSDWWQFQNTADASMFQLRSMRVLDNSNQIKRIRHASFLILLSFMTAWFISLCEARLTQNYYLFIMLQRGMKESGDYFSVIPKYLAYIVGYTLPLILIWLYGIVDSCSIRIKTQLNRFISLEKVFLAAVYFAVGLSLIYYLMKVVRF